MFSAIADGFGYLFSFIADFGKWLLDGLFWMLKPILDLISAIFYFFYYLIIIVVKIIELVVTLCKLLIGLMTGLFMTITGFSYSGSRHTVPEVYDDTFSRIGGIMDTLQLDKVAYLVIFGIWVLTAFYATHIISSMRGGGGE